jgi:hypothetical protein
MKKADKAAHIQYMKILFNIPSAINSLSIGVVEEEDEEVSFNFRYGEFLRTK